MGGWHLTAPGIWGQGVYIRAYCGVVTDKEPTPNIQGARPEPEKPRYLRGSLLTDSMPPAFLVSTAPDHSQLQALNLIDDSLLTSQGQVPRRWMELWERALGTWATWSPPILLSPASTLSSVTRCLP